MTPRSPTTCPVVAARVEKGEGGVSERRRLKGLMATEEWTIEQSLTQYSLVQVWTFIFEYFEIYEFNRALIEPERAF